MKQSFQHFWNNITSVHPSITDIQERGSSKLLAILFSYLIPVFGIVTLRTFLNGFREGFSTSPLFPVSLFVLMLVAFALNRSGKYSLSANIWIFGTSLIVAYNGFATNTAYIGLVLFLIFIQAVLLLSVRSIVILSVLSLATIIAYITLHPEGQLLNSTFALIYPLIGGAIMVAFTSYQNKVESERRQELLNVNDALRQSEVSLELRVKERTRDLELATVVSRQITTVLDLNQLLKAIANETKEAFQLYHVSVFLCDEKQKRLWLAGGSGVIGEQMQQEEKAFFWDTEKGIVPKAAKTQASVLVNDVNGDVYFSRNPALPDTRAELAVPMIANSKLIGVLDLQAQTVNHFNNDIVRVMNMLAEQLAIAVENATLFDQVETARLEQEAVAEKLRAVDNMKSQFLASMSHELRTPLNAILNFSKFVQTGMLGPVNEKQIDALSKAINSGKHLLALINDVLDITKIESDMLNLFVEEDVSLVDELETIAATAETLLTDKPAVQFVRDYDVATLPLIVCDKRRVRQIVLNLVSNSCKFTEEGQVVLSAHVENNQINIAVKDSGPGIPAEDHDLIFEAFRQSRSGLSKGGGTGLGLPIARRLTEAHGGKLWMESTVGEGTTFYVVLPIASPVLADMMKMGRVS
jgi:signal transduction histidine kinase